MRQIICIGKQFDPDASWRERSARGDAIIVGESIVDNRRFLPGGPSSTLSELIAFCRNGESVSRRWDLLVDRGTARSKSLLIVSDAAATTVDIDTSTDVVK